MRHLLAVLGIVVFTAPACGAHTGACQVFEGTQPQFDHPAPSGSTRVPNVSSAARVARFLPITPRHLGTPREIYASKGEISFIFHSPDIGVVIVIETPRHESLARWRDYLNANVGANAQPGHCGTATVVRLRSGARALTTSNPAVRWGYADWLAPGSDVELILEGEHMTATQTQQTANRV